MNLRWKVNQFQAVEKGEGIATYQEMIPPKGKNSFLPGWKNKEVTATASGVIFPFKNNHIYYAVIGHKQDNKDSIKAWVNSLD